MKFKVGDRVRVITHNSDATYGDIGTVNCVDGAIPGHCRYAVELDVARVAYHTCQGRTRKGRGYWLFEDGLELVTDGTKMEIPKQNPVIILREKDGKIVASGNHISKEDGNFIWNAIIALLEYSDK